MQPSQREELKKLFRVHVDPRGTARLTRVLRAVARAIGALARLTGGRARHA